MDFRSYRVKSPVKSFRDLEVYQNTIQLSDEITSLPFLNKEEFEHDNKEIKSIAESIPIPLQEPFRLPQPKPSPILPFPFLKSVTC